MQTTKRNKRKVAGRKQNTKLGEKTQTQIVKELMEKYPDITPKEISTQTGIKLGTIYTIQSRARKNKEVEHTQVADTNHMDTVATLDKPDFSAERASKTELFEHVTSTYLDKIATTDDTEEAKKYNELLIDMMKAL